MHEDTCAFKWGHMLHEDTWECTWAHMLICTRAHVKMHMDKCFYILKGRPVLQSGDVLTWKSYIGCKASDRPTMKSPRTKSAHSYLSFLRGVSHNYAINELRNLGAYLVEIEATETTGMYTNATNVLYYYWCYYCHVEGLNKHHVLTRQALMYLFYANPVFEGVSSCVWECVHNPMDNPMEHVSISWFSMCAHDIHHVFLSFYRKTSTSHQRTALLHAI